MVLLFTSTVTAIEITEVELNPSGSDSGNEWVELFSSSQADLSSYYLENNDGDIINLSGILSSYYVITFPTQWLDNSDEKVFLKQGESVIDSTDVLEDSENNDKTWNLCSGKWIFTESSRESKNICSESREEDPETRENTSDNDSSEEDEDDESPEEESDNKREAQESELINNPIDSPQIRENPNKETIILGNTIENTNEETTFITKSEKTRLYIIYSFTFLTILIIILLALKKL